MERISKSNIAISAVFAFAAILSGTKVLDHAAERYVDSGFERAMIAFAVARSINAVISVLQETEISLQVGVGVTTSPGEILDPINDLIERFSWVVLASGTSFGVQQLFVKILSSPWVAWGIALALATTAVLCFMPRQVPARSARLTSLMLALLVVRFVIPVSAIASDALYQGFFADEFAQAEQSLKQATDDLENLSDQASSSGTETATETPTSVPHSPADADPSVGGRIESGMRAIGKRASDVIEGMSSTVEKLSPSALRGDIEDRIERAERVARDMSEDVIRIIAIFLIETLLLPLMSIWIAYKVAFTQCARCFR